MTPLPQNAPEVPPLAPAAIAGLLLAGRPHLVRLGLASSTSSAILEKTRAGRTRAYELKDALDAVLPTLVRPVGRPTAPSVAAEPARAPITAEVLAFVMDHPGSVSGGRARRRYSDDLRCFLLELRARHSDLDVASFAAAAHVPRPTLELWLADPEAPAPAIQPSWDPDPARGPRIETILCAWQSWQGSFMAFVEHVGSNLHIPYRHTLVAAILAAHGARRPRRRPGRSPDEKATRDAFHTFFAGAQWEADGTPLAIRINDTCYCFNLELDVDAHSAALVGASVSDEEDSSAVIAAFHDGVTTTGAPPLSQTLDNRPSNHCPDVLDALGDTLCIPTTPGRPQNDAYVEGAFGLFKSIAPDLVVNASSGRELAAAIITLVVATWARATNHRPREDRGGRSRVDLYQDKPSPAEVDAARKALHERLRQQELARRTFAARINPIVRAMLDKAFAHLALDDPDGNVRDAIARYPLDAVLAGIAVFEGKRAALTLPVTAGARYLLGIVRNIAERDEGLAVTQALMDARLEARDLILLALAASRDRIVADAADPVRAVNGLVREALATGRHLDRLFFLAAAADLIRQQPDPRPLYDSATRRIHTTFRIPHAERLDASRFLVTRVVPLA